MSTVQAPVVTWLYVPGDRPDRFAKALASGAGAVILDLEDAVLAGSKDAARRNVRGFLADRGAPEPGSPQVHVRINPPRSEHGARDLEVLAELTGPARPVGTGPAHPGAAVPDAVRVPKVEGAADVDLAAQRLHPGTEVHCLLESALGMQHAADIAAHPRTRALALGEADLAAQLGLRGDAAYTWLRSAAVVAAAAAGLPAPAMSAYIDVTDTEGLRASCREGRDLGMFGRTAIHPRQIPVIRSAFTPTATEVERAREIAAAAETGAADGAGALALADGRFIDAPVVDSALRTIALADHLGPTPE
ncbi:CoA ester lyase [Streptomonospora sediminis]